MDYKFLGDLRHAEQRHRSTRAQIFERPLHAAPLAASPAPAMILRLRFDNTTLRRRVYMPARRQRHPVNRGVYSATAALPLTS
jgi:hypothetical protein